jgi:hypothetical protein
MPLGSKMKPSKKGVVAKCNCLKKLWQQNATAVFEIKMPLDSNLQLPKKDDSRKMQPNY